MVKYDSQKIDYQLHIDSGYYNTLDIEGFSRMMKNPSYCYVLLVRGRCSVDFGRQERSFLR